MPTRISNGARRLLAWRSARGLSQQRASAALDVQQSRLSEYELGKRRPSLITAARIEQRTEGVVPCSAWLETDAGSDAALAAANG